MAASGLQVAGPMLGCASDYTVALMPRGGAQAGPALGVFRGLSSLTWERVVDNPSSCKLTVGLDQGANKFAAQCCAAAAQVEKFATELHVFRHTDAAVAKVWEGPVIMKDESVETGVFTVQAWDVLEWLKVRVNHTDWVFTLDASQAVAYMIADALLPDDPHVTEHMVVALAGGPALTDNTPAESVNVWSHMNQVLTSQVDLTTVGRRVVVIGEGAAPWSKTIIIGPDDIAGDVTQGDDGTNYANRLIVAGSGVSRTAKRTMSGQIVQDDPTLPVAAGDGDDTYHGLVEHLVKMNQVTSRAQAWAAASSLLAFSEHSGYVRAASGAQLLPTARVALSDLVCGTVVQMVPSPFFCTKLPPQAQLSLAQLSVSWQANTGEKVGIGLAVTNAAAARLLNSGA